MRKPNGYGSVYRLNGKKRRNPWAARKTTGWNDKGQPIYSFIGFYPTREEAENALAKFNLSPYDTRKTFGQAVDEWSRKAYPQMKPRTKTDYDYIFGKLKPLFKMPIADIRLADMQSLVSKETRSTGSKMKVGLGKIFDYAVRNEIVNSDRRDLVHYIEVSGEIRKVERKVFSTEEIEKVTDPIVKILIYTGLRAGEFVGLRPEDVDLENRRLKILKSKTEAGIRTVPICEKIVPCFGEIDYSDSYKVVYAKVRAYGHSPHDTRHTFISLCADRGIDERVTKAIVGHKGTDITESVYTHINFSVLLDAVNKL